MQRLIALIALLYLSSCGTISPKDSSTSVELRSQSKMELGNFSVSLTVKDLAKSRDFYTKLGFEEVGGNASQNWLVLRNGTSKIGLFQGMFPKNLLTFNPGWDSSAQALSEFKGIRDIQRQLKKNGLELTTEVDESTSGPASLTLIDPDGNPILIDQHVK